MSTSASHIEPCLTPDELAMYFADELTPPLRDVIERHLSTCDSCSGLADDIAECVVWSLEEDLPDLDRPAPDASGPVRPESPAPQPPAEDPVLAEMRTVLREICRAECNMAGKTALEHILRGHTEFTFA